MSIDTNTKAEVYRRTGVREYIIWRVIDEALDWFVLRDEQFVPLMPDSKGVYKIEVFPGLWLDADALIRDDDQQRLVRVARKGTASRAYTSFVAKLAGATK